MKLSSLAAAAMLLGAAAATAETPDAAVPLSLAEAQRRAQAVHPEVQAREVQLAAVAGLGTEASRPLFNNPSVSLEGTRRRAEAGARSREWAAGLSQTFEIAGQQSRRREVAAATQESLHAEIAAARQKAFAEATRAFVGVWSASRRVAIEQRAVQLAETTARAVARRQAAGEDTALDANVAAIEAERAANALAQAQESLDQARAALVTVLQWPQPAAPEVAGSLPLPSATPAPYTLPELLAALADQPALRALAAREEGARARVELERAARYPDVTVGLAVGREGPAAERERTTTVSLSVPLPLFKRNEAALGAALGDAGQAGIERRAASREAEVQVRLLWARLASQHMRVQRLQRTVDAAVAQNQRLASRSRGAGQIGLLDELLVNRQALDAEREFNDALAEYHLTRIELEQTAGWPQEGLIR